MADRAARRARRAASRGRDPLGLRRALSDRLLPGLVAAMALLAAIALGGAQGAALLATRWQAGAAAAVMVQVPDPDAPLDAPGRPRRLDAALAALRAMPEVTEAAPMDPARMRALLRPWLGEINDLPVPGVIELRLRPGLADPPLKARLDAVLPGTAVEAHGLWVSRLGALARSLQALALVALLLVAGIAAAVVTVATRAGLTARRDSIVILHTLGATDGDIAGRFARRVFALAGSGALAGALAAVPVLAGLAGLAAPLLGGTVAGAPDFDWAGLPWIPLLALPPLAAAIGWLTAQTTVRRWLRRLP